MGLLKLSALILIPLVSILSAILVPKLVFVGVWREVEGLNNKECTSIKGLEACEDAWIHHPSSLAYLACSTLSSRHAWLPAVLHLNSTALPSPVGHTDYLAVLDLSSPVHKYTRLSIEGTPEDWPGLFVHGLDLVPSSSEEEGVYVVYAISHRPPLDSESDGQDASKVGARSVVEVFETELGSGTMKWLRTVEHELVRTPNNLVGLEGGGFYVSNDHRRKVHWSRHLEVFHSEPSDIIYCSVPLSSSTAPSDCKVAASDLIYPNGLTKAPNSEILYSASSIGSSLTLFTLQADHTLSLLDSIPLPRIMDNIHLDPITGEVYVTTIPKLLAFGKGKSAVEVWKIGEEKGEARFYGQKWIVEKVFGDDGTRVSGVTSAVPFRVGGGEGGRTKLLLTGVWSEEVVVCAMPE